jgi:DNA-binding beta-propeller fold protein YncE
MTDVSEASGASARDQEGNEEERFMNARWALLASLSAVLGCGGPAPAQPEDVAARPDTIFAAVEEDGTLVELDGITGVLVRTIDLSAQAHGGIVKFDVHNVQASPDGHTVWLTAMPATTTGEHGAEPMPEQLIGVQTSTSRVKSRIELGDKLHVAHVVVRGTLAYVTAYDADAVLVVDLETERVLQAVMLPAGTGPHGARLTPDGVNLVVAGMGDGSLHVVHTPSRHVVLSHSLPGRAVQAAVSDDGATAFATVYDTRQVARLELGSGSLSLFDLPADAAGPVQLYPSPDGTLWIADQGMLDGDPVGDRLFRMSQSDGVVDRAVEVSPGPHGVVVNPEIGIVWTTTLLEGRVEAVDIESGEIVWSTPVGNGPNGITCLHTGGAMP